MGNFDWDWKENHPDIICSNHEVLKIIRDAKCKFELHDYDLIHMNDYLAVHNRQIGFHIVSLNDSEYSSRKI